MLNNQKQSQFANRPFLIIVLNGSQTVPKINKLSFFAPLAINKIISLRFHFEIKISVYTFLNRHTGGRLFYSSCSFSNRRLCTVGLFPD